MKKIYLLIITVLCCVILFMNVDFNVYADGKYVFEGDKYDENYDFINSNIEIVNLLAEQDVVSVTEEKL